MSLTWLGSFEPRSTWTRWLACSNAMCPMGLGLRRLRRCSPSALQKRASTGRDSSRWLRKRLGMAFLVLTGHCLPQMGELNMLSSFRSFASFPFPPTHSYSFSMLISSCPNPQPNGRVRRMAAPLSSQRGTESPQKSRRRETRPSPFRHEHALVGRLLRANHRQPTEIPRPRARLL